MYDEAYRKLAWQHDSWIIKNRQKILERLFKKFGVIELGKCLDVGMGTGANVKFLENYCCKLVGLEYSELALNYAAELLPDREFIKGDANKLVDIFDCATFDLVTFFGVLVHKYILDEFDVLRQAAALLKTGGYIMVTEAAFNFLTRDSDSEGMTSRRYTISHFRDLFDRAGFKMIYCSYFNIIPFPAVFVLAMYDKIKKVFFQKQVLEKKINNNIGSKESQFLDGLMMRIMGIERFLLCMGTHFPIGVSLICIGQKQ